MDSLIQTMDLVGHHVYHYRCVGSTNKVARLLARQKACGGTVVVADEQLHGEGRRGNHWHSPFGGLWFSLILDSPEKRESMFIYPLLAATAVAEVLTRDYGCPASLSWPNDVVVRGRKICGVMCKTWAGSGSPSYGILGVGLNLNNKVFPSHLGATATSLSMITGIEVAPLVFLESLLPLIDCLNDLARSNQSSLVARLQESLPYVGSLVNLRSSDGDRVVRLMGIDERGCLIIVSETGQKQHIGPQELVSVMPLEKAITKSR